MNPVRVDTEDLIIALDSNENEVTWYLDLSNGEVVPLFFDLIDEDENAALVETIENEPDRFVRIEPVGPREAFSIMDAFIDTLPDGAPAKRLSSALGQRRPFRHFKDELLAWPQIREQWFRFHFARMRENALEWITAHELQVILVERPTLSSET